MTYGCFVVLYLWNKKTLKFEIVTENLNGTFEVYNIKLVNQSTGNVCYKCNLHFANTLCQRRASCKMVFAVTKLIFLDVTMSVL